MRRRISSADTAENELTTTTTVTAEDVATAVDDNDSRSDSTRTITDEPSTPSAPRKQQQQQHRRRLMDRLRSKGRQLREENTPLRSIVENYYRVEHTTADELLGLARHRPQAAKAGQQIHTNNYSLTDHNNRSTVGRMRQPRALRVVLPGVPRYEEDWPRDSHDFFNLVVLVPVTLLNVMNWNWDILLTAFPATTTSVLASAWTGEWFLVFFGVTVAYFLVDLVWILVQPCCVKSPMTILQHHVATLLYLFIPYFRPQVRWCMGACMSVEINTWFLIARRVFNKQGFPPWTVQFWGSWLSIRVKVISIFFYVSWILIRVILYPALLLPFYQEWRQLSKTNGTAINVLLPTVPLHLAFCLLNLKWTYELFMSKIRYWRRQRLRRNGHALSEPSVSKGL